MFWILSTGQMLYICDIILQGQNFCKIILHKKYSFNIFLAFYIKVYWKIYIPSPSSVFKAQYQDHCRFQSGRISAVAILRLGLHHSL